MENTSALMELWDFSSKLGNIVDLHFVRDIPGGWSRHEYDEMFDKMKSEFIEIASRIINTSHIMAMSYKNDYESREDFERDMSENLEMIYDNILAKESKYVYRKRKNANFDSKPLCLAHDIYLLSAMFNRFSKNIETWDISNVYLRPRKEDIERSREYNMILGQAILERLNFLIKKASLSEYREDLTNLKKLTAKLYNDKFGKHLPKVGFDEVSKEF